MTVHDERAQLEALVHLLMQARTGLEMIDMDSTASTAYMHARNARIDLNEALRRLYYVLGEASATPASPPSSEPR